MFIAADPPFTDEWEFESDRLDPWERPDPGSQQNSQVAHVFSIGKLTLSSFAVAQTEPFQPARSLSWGVQGKEGTMHGSDPQASHNQSELMDGGSSPWRHVSGNDVAGI